MSARWNEPGDLTCTIDPPSHFAVLRHVVESGVEDQIEDVTVTVPAAALILQIYEQLTPQTQEAFALECASGFWSATWKWLGRTLAREIAEAIAQLP